MQMKNFEAHKAVDPEKFAETFKETGSIKEAMLAAGYAESSAARGRHKLSQECLSALVDRGIKLGRKYSAEDRRDWVRGKLLQNSVEGKDTAVKSLELLGKDKEVGLFTPDSQVGVIILQAPPDLNVHAAIQEPPQLGEPTDVDGN